MCKEIAPPGSPPRGRGKVARPFVHIGFPGITPAWAGKRHRLTHLPNTPGDHPRVGGEKYCIISCSLCQWGSPPRGRGKVQNALFFRSFIRITPAWAGKSDCDRCVEVVSEDHPRVGGEKAAFHAWLCCILGSPPRGRGKAGTLYSGMQRMGITPAWAGKSQTAFCGTASSGDHPRVGGEKNIVRKASFDPEGSPPRGRGKVMMTGALKWFRRITPAWAGKRRSAVQKSEQSGDHPRVGGEKVASAPESFKSLGSPPRGRGKVKLPVCQCFSAGITPAWAGKSYQASCPAAPR